MDRKSIAIMERKNKNQIQRIGSLEAEVSFFAENVLRLLKKISESSGEKVYIEGVYSSKSKQLYKTIVSEM